MFHLAMLAAGALSLMQAAPPQASWHARDATAFVEIADVPNALAAGEHAPWNQMLRDETVRNAFDAVFTELHVDLDSAFASVLHALGVPESTPIHSHQDALALLRTLRGASLSLGFDEAAPGELATTIRRWREAADALGRWRSALDGFASAHDGKFPASAQELALAPELASDPWGAPYRYSVSDDLSTFHVVSLGSDRAEGGTGSAADVDESFNVEAQATSELAQRFYALAVIDFVTEAACRTALDALDVLATSDGTSAAKTASVGAEAMDLRHFKVARLDDRAGWSLHAGERLVVGLGAIKAEDAVQRANGKLASFAASPAMQRLSALPPASGATIVRGVFNGEGAVHVAQLQAALARSGPMSTLAKVVPSCKSAGWRMQLEGERFTTEIVTQRAPSTPTWLDALGTTAVPAKLAQCVPEDAIAVYLTTIDGPALCARLTEALGADGADALAQMQAKHEFDLQRDVFANLGPGCAGYVLPIATVMGLPGVAVVLDLRDAAAFERGVRGLVAALGERPDSGFKIRADRYRVVSVGEFPYWTLTFGGESGGPASMLSLAPTLALVNGRAVVTLNSTRAKKEIRRLVGELVAAHPLAKLEHAPPPEATSIGFMDWAKLFDGLYTGGRAALGLVPANASLPFDVSKISAALPESKALTRFYQPTVLWSRPIEGGTYTQWESSFGPETWGSLIVLGAEIGYAVNAQAANPPAAAAPAEVTSDAHAASTREQLDWLATRLAVFHLEQGRWPKTLDELSQPTSNFPQGFLDGAALPQDAWQHAFRYELSADGASYRLWSIGPDGADGSGDDLVAP